MPQDRITLRQELPVQLNDRHALGWIARKDRMRALHFRIFAEGISNVGVRNTCVFEKQADDLAATARLEVEVVDLQPSIQQLVGYSIRLSKR